LPASASAAIVEQAAGPGPDAAETPKYSIKFGVIGLDHYHIMGMTAAIIRGGGELVSFYSNLPRLLPISRRYPNARLAKNEDEILDDPSLKLNRGRADSPLAAPLGHRAMKRGKDFLSDKPAVTRSSNWRTSVKSQPKPAKCSPLCTPSGWRYAPPCRQDT